MGAARSISALEIRRNALSRKELRRGFGDRKKYFSRP
jgi:hypothetical protein